MRGDARGRQRLVGACRGRAARKAIERAREAVAILTGVAPRQVLFTSGATEANVTALTPVMRRGGEEVRFSRLFVSAVEHPSVLRGGRFPAERVTEIPVDQDGLVRHDELAVRLEAERGAGGRPLVAIQLANSETGVIQPIADLAPIVRAAGGVFVCDAVQASGRVRLDDPTLDVDFLTLSAHKIGGIQGAGALIARDPELWPVALMPGGGQEQNRRGGTENTPAIAAFGAAAALATGEPLSLSPLSGLRDWLEDRLRTIYPHVAIHGARAPRIFNTSLVSVPGWPAETAVIAFDLAGIAVSSGSACSSGKVGASHVLKAMGVVEGGDFRGAVRFSLGWNTTRADVEAAAAAFERIAARFSARTLSDRSAAL
ncbi:cysteine desulfurase family protein [Methyloraptor flagellatus]|uniref:Cysteine desulfurase n=1 Tax=Methyloraptor flagellatus TaxID=3162530 RepID=A0AAU7XDG1_9HYPH